MSTTAAEIMERVQAKGYGSDTETAQLAMLNQVQRRIVNSRRWAFLLSSTEKTTTTGVESVALDAEIGPTIRVDGVELTESNGSPLDTEYVEPPVIREYIHDSSATGRPRFWSRIGQNLIFYPIPDAAYKVKVYTVANPVIATKTDKVTIPDSHTDILEWGIIEQLTFRERDWDAHNFARQMYAELFTEMLGQYGMQQRGQATHVTSSGSWDNYDVEEAWPTFVVS